VDVPASRSLQEVRERIDALDRQLVRLLAERFAYGKQAAGFKKSAEEVPAPERVERVIANVRALATEAGAPEEGVEKVYRALIQAMIDLELQLHAKKTR
jgi:isochorismate pyruvate lyase